LAGPARVLRIATRPVPPTPVFNLEVARLHRYPVTSLGLRVHNDCDAARRRVRTAPRDLAEKLALDEAKGGAGTRIMKGKVNDPKFPEDVWAKMQHVHEHPDGTQTVIHYWENLQTGAREGYKFK